jgi:ParB-like chromosome segregation protein Spo0J
LKLKTTRARVLLAKLKKRPRRINPGIREQVIALARSWLANPIHDILVRASDMVIADGHRRVEGLELLGETEADVTLLEGDVSDRDLDRMAMVSAYHRSPLGGYEQACILRSMKEAEGVTNKDLAEEMQIDGSMPTKLLSVFDCIPAAQEAAKAGKIGVSVWYAISRVADQMAALQAALNGSTRDELQRRSRKNGSVDRTIQNAPPPVRMPRIKIPLATEAAIGTVTLAGENIDLDDAEILLKEAMKAVRDAKAKNLDTKTAQAVWRDVAKAGA